MYEIFEKIKDLRVLVIGDIILDKYYYTSVERISPEAPIPIAKFQKEKVILGGAANVAKNLVKLGCKTTLVGQVGKDKEAKIVKKLLNEDSIYFKEIIALENTISKTRIVSGSNQLIRLDYEETKDIDFKKISSLIEKIINNFDLIIISDYKKGLITKDLIKYLKGIDKYISIDTKPGSFEDFENFSLIKPNFKEAVGIAEKLGSKETYNNNNDDVELLGKFLKTKLKANILITRSKSGASYIGNIIYHSKTEVSEIVDVTGAGDTCLSIFSVLDYLEIKKDTALKIMNVAAKITVSHLGTYSPSSEEIKKELFKEDISNIIGYENISILIENLKKDKKKIVFTNGCFDLLHRGHISLLKEAKSKGDILIVGINSDESVRKLKGNSRPIIDEESRAYVLSNLQVVDYVVIFNQLDPRKIIEIIKPDIHVKGGDYKKEELIETSTVEKFGGRVEIIKLSEGYSTTNIEKKIKNANK